VNLLAIALVTLFIGMCSIQYGATLSRALFPMLGATGATFWRLTLAAILLGLIWRPWKTPLTRAQLKGVLFYGCALGIMNLTFYFAIERIPLGVAVALEFTGPLAVAIYNSRRVVDFIWATLAAIGLYLLLPLTNTSTLDPIGVVMALTAGFCWALYIIFGQRTSQNLPGGLAATWGMIFAAMVVFPVGVVKLGLELWQPQLAIMAILVAVFSSALPYSLEMIALKRLKAHTFSILMSLEPAIATLMGLIFLREFLGMIEMIAIACIMLASLGSALTQKA
jgi:inner membrane transporter RhtA